MVALVIVLGVGGFGGFIAHMAISGALKADIAAIRADLAAIKAKLP